MFDPDSRYAGVEAVTFIVTAADGSARQLRYVRRRFLPNPDAQPELTLHTVEAADRLDNIAARYLGDPTKFWRICDGNLVLRPEELTQNPNGTIRVPLILR